MTTAERQAVSMTLLQLAMRFQNAPANRQAWTPLELAARDEYDRRVLALEGRAA